MQYLYAVVLLLIQAFLVWKIIKAALRAREGLKKAKEDRVLKNDKLREAIREEERAKLIAEGRLVK